MTTQKSPKVAKKFLCEKCNYICSKQSDFNKHLLTAKHKILQNATQKSPKVAKAFLCDCGKKYKHHSSLWKHKKTCPRMNNYMITQENLEEKPSIMDIITQNKEIMDALVLQNEQLMKKNTELCHRVSTKNTFIFL